MGVSVNSPLGRGHRHFLSPSRSSPSEQLASAPAVRETEEPRDLSLLCPPDPRHRPSFTPGEASSLLGRPPPHSLSHLICSFTFSPRSPRLSFLSFR